MNEQLKKKLATLPKEPGVYFHKAADGEVLYVGKAAVLKNRVRQYFQASKTRDVKTEALVAEIVDTDWMVVESELEALFLEAEMIRRYMPRYNILLRDDKALSYIRISYQSDYPTVTTTRRPLDDGAVYYGPYFSLYNVREALKLLRRIFPFATVQARGQKRESLHYHLGLDPGLEAGKTSLLEYRQNLRRLMAVIEGKKATILRELEKDMAHAAKLERFEEAARVRNQVRALKELGRQVVFSDKEFLDISKDHALNELVDVLMLDAIPMRIEGFDISHMSGTNVVASMVVFTNGVSNKGEYRKFKTTQEKNDDFYNMHETIRRRLSEKNVKAWGLPNLFLIDGGKGQLEAALRAQRDAGYTIPMIGLTKQHEQIVVEKALTVDYQKIATLGGYTTETDMFVVVTLPSSSHLVKLLQRIRDESHRFAVSYHTVLKRRAQTRSELDDIPGVGPITRRKIIRAFGSIRAIKQASLPELQAAVGDKIAQRIYRHTHGASGIIN